MTVSSDSGGRRDGAKEGAERADCKLRQTIATVRDDGRNRDCRCPAHDDQQASLSIGRGGDGRLLLHCQAGCSTAAVLSAAGLTWADIHNPRAAPGKILATHDYRDEAGTLLYQVLRFAPKHFRQRRPDGTGGWEWRLGDVRRVLYRLPELVESRVVYVAEGEKDVDRLRGLGLMATCNAGGAGKWRDDYTCQLLGAGVKHAIILPDNDEPGRQHAESVARACHSAGLRVQVVLLPRLSEKGDVSDWLNGGHSHSDLISVVANTPDWPSQQDQGSATVASPSAAPNTGRRSQADQLVQLALDASTELWHTPEGDGYITVRLANHLEHHPIAGRTTRNFLARLYHRRNGRTPNSRSIGDALSTLNGIACFDGPQHEVRVRLAGQGDRVYLDLGDSAWRAVEITRAGWRVVEAPPVRFRRGRALLALPEPVHGQSLDALRDVIHVAAEDDWRLLMFWLVGALRPVGPYSLLALDGEQGAGKSTTARLLRRLLDPSAADLRAEPREIRDLMIAASGGWIVALDNLSHVQPWLSDALCRLSTGGALSTRQLYTDGDEYIVEAIRPIILTGITSVITRGDLQDRAIAITLPAIPDRLRQPEAELWSRYDRIRSGVLGALLDAVACALRCEHEVKLDAPPRMADAARWATAAEPAMGIPTGGIVHAYADRRQQLAEATLEGDPLAAAIDAVPRPWDGTAAELLARVTPTGRLPRGWPESPRALGGALRRLAPQLRRLGIDLDVGRRRQAHSGRRLIVLSDALEEEKPSASSPPVARENAAGAVSAPPTPLTGMVTGRSPIESTGLTSRDGGDDGDGCIPSIRLDDTDALRI